MFAMNEIHRSVVVDTLKVFAITTVAALLLMTLGGGAKEGVARGLPPALVARILPYLVPEMLRFVVPGCLLFAVCSVFGRMSADNEIVALKALGISPLRIVWPTLVVAYALSMFTYWLYDVCAVWARPNLQREVSQSIHEIAYSYLRANRSFSSQGAAIVVRDVSGDQLIGPLITLEAGRGGLPVTIRAARARLSSEPSRGVLRVECEDSEVDVVGRGNLRFPDGFAHDIVLRDFHQVHEDHRSPAGLGLAVIPRQIVRERQEVERLESALRAHDHSSSAPPAQLLQSRDSRRERLHRLLAEPHRRLANGLGCLCFALVGVPVALLRRSGDVMSVFFVCFLPILLVYYPLLMLGESLARQGVYPQCSVWLADSALCAAGGLLLYRSTRH